MIRNWSFALAKCQVGATKNGFQYLGEINQYPVAFERSELGADGAKAVQVDRHESQAAAHAVRARNFAGNQFIQGPPVQELGEGSIRERLSSRSFSTSSRIKARRVLFSVRFWDRR